MDIGKRGSIPGEIGRRELTGGERVYTCPQTTNQGLDYVHEKATISTPISLRK